VLSGISCVKVGSNGGFCEHGDELTFGSLTVGSLSTS
jgi:hypothetical protein